jgi:hypothetical protein
MTITIKHEILEEIGSDLQKNEAPEKLYSQLEEDHLIDLTRKKTLEANKEFTTGKGQFIQTLRPHDLSEGDTHFADQNREKVMAERLAHALENQESLLPMAEKRGYFPLFNFFRPEKKEIPEKTEKPDHTPKNSAR